MESLQKLRKGRLVIPVLLVFFALIAVALVVSRSQTADQAAVDPHGTALPDERVVQLSVEMPSPSTFDGLHAQLVRGAMPDSEVQATVLTDEECQPDEYGISRCLNRLELVADGSQLEVRHPHDMHEVPCLAPGESVRLTPALDS